MSKYLEFDKKHFGIEGLIPLKKGDDWSLDAKIIEKIGNYTKEVDLTGASATAYFKGATGEVAVSAVIIAASCGQLRIEADEVTSMLVKESPGGSSVYVITENAGKTETVETAYEPIQVTSRSVRIF